MKVKQRGKDKKYEVTCPRCNSDLEYQECDIFGKEERRVGGIVRTVEHWFKKPERYTSVYVHSESCVRCPVCKHEIIIGIRKFPELVGWEEIK